MAEFDLDDSAIPLPDLESSVVETEEGYEVTFGDAEMLADEEAEALLSVPFGANLAEYFDPEEIAWLGQEVVDSTNADLAARREWEDQIIKGLDQLGLKIEETNEPFTGACTANHPLIIESALKFQAKAISEIFPPQGPVKAQILGPISDESRMRANNVQLYMNWQCTKEMPEYFEEKEKLLLYTALVGSGFTKTYWSNDLIRPVVEHVPVTDFVVPMEAKDLRTTPRMTHILGYLEEQMQEAQRTGQYIADDIGEPSKIATSPLTDKINELQGLKVGWTEDTGYTLYEQHRNVQLAKFGDTHPRPYIVTVEKESGRVLAIYRGWAEDDPAEQRRLYFTHYRFTPGLTFYGMGLIQLLGNLAKTINASLRSLVDSGQFANLQGGFKAKGVRVTNDDPIAPGTWKEVEATGLDLSKAFFALPYKEPSQTLERLMGSMVGAAQKFADSTDQVVADSTNYGPVGTTMALLDASSKFYSAIHKRLHKAQGDELELLRQLNKRYLPPAGKTFGVPGADVTIVPEDFADNVNVVPVSDPNISSQAHRVAINQMLYQVANENPGLIDKSEVIRRGFLDMNISESEKLFVKPQQAQPLDPVSDIMAAVKGSPIGAFPEQDHDAHIAVKTAWMQDPVNGANPVMGTVLPIIQANVKEHMVLKYKAQMDGLMAMQMDALNAAAQVLKANENAGDDLDIDRATIALKEKDLALKSQKAAGDLIAKGAAEANRSRELDIREKELAQNLEVKNKELQQKSLAMLVDTADKVANHEQKSEDRRAKVRGAGAKNQKPAQ